MQIRKYDAFVKLQLFEKERIASFLHKHLGVYGDDRSAILKAIEYAVKERSGMGGFVMTIEEGDLILGACVVNQTGMEEYIPENILVYIATHEDYRGRGLGKRLMEQALNECRGSVALHVEADNPAKKLYEKLGFENKYLEMRLNA